WNKLSVAIGVLAASMLLTTAVWAILQPVFFTEPFSNLDYWNYAGFVATGAIASLGLSMAVSTVLDRAISTAMVSIVAAIALQIVFSVLLGYCQFQGLSNDPSTTEGVLITLAAPPAFFASYWAFTRGESLRSFRRFELLLLGGTLGALIAWVPSAAVYEWLAAFRPTGS
ncbi:MAG: hypothetical protein LC772_00175, partial [Chloroflexi bacterium]|nr:hypothetical protein [Chloroflexota bacterium]